MKLLSLLVEMPSTFKAFLPIVLPIVLIGIGSVAAFTGGDTGFVNFLIFLGTPSVALIIRSVCGIFTTA